MSSSKGNVPAQQAQAWKRPGKQSASASEPATTSGRLTVGHPSSAHEGTPGKRKLEAHAPPHSNSSHVAKRPRKDETTTDRNGQQLKKKKSVTFADVPSKNNSATGSKSKSASADTTEKKSKGPAKKKKTPPPTDIKPALEYLRLWKTARSSWKFNKNHQSTLIKHVFDVDGIPAADIEAFYEYIQDLKGFVRMRLRETALEIRTKDQSDGGDAFPEGTSDVDATQERYETILAKFLRSQPVGSKRKAFDEESYTSDSDDGDVIIQRLVKRMRAELIIDELSDRDTNMSTTSSTLSKTVTGSHNNITTTNAGKRIKLNDGTSKRRRKLRVNLDDTDTETSDSSSSSSESDSDSDTSDSDTESESGSDTSSSGGSTSSEGSSSDEGEEQNDGDESSSSSSSSSSDSDDTSEDDSDDEDEGDA